VNRLRLASRQVCKLSDNADHAFAAQHTLCHYPSNSIYTFIPKNGCTSIRFALARGNGCIEGVSEFQWIHQNNRTFTASLRETVTADYSFVILRCPFRRIVSFYLDKVVKGIAPATQLIATENHTGSHLPLEQMSFEHLIELLKDEAIRKRNNHWRNQSDFLVLKEYGDYFCLENMAEAIDMIRSKTGLEIMDTRNISKHGTSHLEKVSSGYFGNESARQLRELISNGKVPSYETMYKKVTRDIVKEVYADDIALYLEHFSECNLLFPME